VGPTNLRHNPTTRSLQARASRAYASSAQGSLQEKYILEHLALVRHVVNKTTAHLTRVEDKDDLVSAGTLGLVKAAHSFDPSRDVNFKTYAYIRIRGAVLDELRSRSFSPSMLHGHIRRVRTVYARLQSRLGRPPADEEMAGELGVPLEQYYRTLEEARRQHFLSIHGLGDEREPALGKFALADRGPSPLTVVERRETLQRMSAAIKELPSRDRILLLLYYERDLTLKEVAAVLELTEGRVSQLHAAALFKLAMKMNEPEP